MRDALFLGSTQWALKIPVTFIAGFQSLALGLLRQPLCWAPLLPEAQFLLRISGRVTIIPFSPTCTWHNSPSGLSSVLLIVKPVSLFLLSLFSFSGGGWVCIFPQSVVSVVKIACLEKNLLFWLTRSFQRWEGAPSVFSVSLWNGNSWDLLYRLDDVESSAQCQEPAVKKVRRPGPQELGSNSTPSSQLLKNS